MNCDMCGKEESLYVILVEGTELNVCNNCAKFGKILQKVEKPVLKKKKQETTSEKPEEPVIIQLIVDDYAEKIRKSREKLGLNQKDFARKISEKESLVSAFETGKTEPSIKMAQKLEKLLKIRLIEDVEEKKEEVSKTKTEEFTIGDFIRIR